MTRAYGTVNALEIQGGLEYEALYQPSYRHAARTIASSSPGGLWISEADAIDAIERAAIADGADVTVQAGAYPGGTRRRGDILAGS